MSLEIERKFLVFNDDWKMSVTRAIRIRDGLVASNNGQKVRVRIADSTATITLKSRRRGMTRSEFEYPIPLSDAEEILRVMCNGEVLEKVRHCVPHAGVVWHVDVYQGILSGVVIAEVELRSTDQQIECPNWVEKEVTEESAYRKINMRAQRMANSRQNAPR